MDDMKDFREVFKLLWKVGVRVLVFGVGFGVDEKELWFIVERDGDVLFVKFFIELISRVGVLIKFMCNLVGKSFFYSKDFIYSWKIGWMVEIYWESVVFEMNGFKLLLMVYWWICSILIFVNWF